MRCGTYNNDNTTAAAQTQPAAPASIDPVQGQPVPVAGPVPTQMSRDEITKLIKGSEEDQMDTVALTVLSAVAIIMAFVYTAGIAITTMDLKDLISSSISSDISEVKIYFRIIMALLPVGGLIAISIKKYIDTTYRTAHDTATDSVIKDLFKYSVLVLFVYFTASLLLEILFITKYTGFTMEIFTGIFEIVKFFFTEMWQIALIYLGFLGLVALLLNVCKQQYNLIKTATGIGFIIMLVLYFVS
jgi:hypothetical protein